MKYKYARVSSGGQNLTIQVQTLKGWTELYDLIGCYRHSANSIANSSIRGKWLQSIDEV